MKLKCNQIWRFNNGKEIVDHKILNVDGSIVWWETIYRNDGIALISDYVEENTFIKWTNRKEVTLLNQELILFI